MTKQLVGFGMAVMTTLLALLVLWQFRFVAVYVLISLMLAAALRPLANPLVGRGLVMRVAWILLFLAALGIFLFLSGESAYHEIRQLAQTVSVEGAWRLPVWLQDSSFQQALVERLPPPSKLFEAVTGDEGQLVLPAIIGVTQGIGSGISGGLIILFLSIYWSTNQIHFERLWLSLLPSDERKQARGIWRTIEPEIGAYIRGELTQSILTGLLLALGYWLLGSPYPVLLALVGSLASLIPMVGIVLAVISVLLVGLLTSLQLSLFTAIFTLVIFTVLGGWVKPRLLNRRWENHILTIVLLIALADAFGVIGIIVAPPVSVVCQILWSRLVSRRTVLGTTTQVSDLKEREESLWEAIQSMDEPPVAQVTNSMERLSHLIKKAEPVLQAGLPVSLSAATPELFQSSQPITVEGESPSSIKS